MVQKALLAHTAAQHNCLRNSRPRGAVFWPIL